MADFAAQLDAEIILVVGMKLGCINHAMLTAELIRQSGLKLKGWIANHIDPAMSRPDENFAYLQSHIPAPCLGRIPHSADISPAELTRYIQTSPFSDR